ncbi:MAG: GNAT family N-acetyltransferase [Desulfobacteraceae bacterium]|jgi:predicted acetyltransferase
MEQLSLLKSTRELFPLKDEIVQFALDTEADKIHLGDYELMKTDPEAYLIDVENQSKGIGLPDKWVSHTRYWYIRNASRIIGSIDMRHYLTPNLEDLGGHIGYVIRPGERNKGYATSMLREVIHEAAKLGIKKLLITAASDNIASRKVIEKNKGILDGERFSHIAGRMTAYCWIEVI